MGALFATRYKSVIITGVCQDFASNSTKPQENGMFVKSKLPIVFLATCVLCSAAQAKTFDGPTTLSSQEFETLTINGPADLDRVKSNTLTVNGPLKFNEVKISAKTEVSGPSKGEEGKFGNVMINGPFEASKVKCDNLVVKGPVSLTKFTINGDTHIEGPLEAKKGTFNDIKSVTPPVLLQDIDIKNITIKKPSNGKDDTLTLSGETTVSGNITFESGNGKVIMKDKDSTIKGKIIGGQLVK